MVRPSGKVSSNVERFAGGLSSLCLDHTNMHTHTRHEATILVDVGEAYPPDC